MTCFKRVKYEDLDGVEAAIYAGYELVQLKYDGIWCRLVVKNQVGHFYSRNDECKKVEHVALPDCVLIGELMFGTQWSKHPQRAGKFYAFDIENDRNRHYEKEDYGRRYSALVRFLCTYGQEPSVRAVTVLDIKQAHDVEVKIRNGHIGYEGLVFRKNSTLHDGVIGRWKKDVVDDAVIIDIYEGKPGTRLEGSLGGVTVGKFDQAGVLRELYKVGGGFSDPLRREIWSTWPAWKGRVIESVGKARFESGALRHPNFLRVRDDKQPHECLLQ